MSDSASIFDILDITETLRENIKDIQRDIYVQCTEKYDEEWFHQLINDLEIVYNIIGAYPDICNKGFKNNDLENNIFLKHNGVNLYNEVVECCQDSSYVKDNERSYKANLDRDHYTIKCQLSTYKKDDQLAVVMYCLAEVHNIPEKQINISIVCIPEDMELSL